MTVFPVEIDCGRGGVHISEIHAILPDEKNADRSWLYASMFPNGLWIRGKAEELCALWWAALEPEEEDE